MLRRTFIASGAAALAAAAQENSMLKPGIDLYSIRDSGWTPFEYLDYAAKLSAQVVHFSEIRFIGSLETDNLQRVRRHAEELGIEIEIGRASCRERV